MGYNKLLGAGLPNTVRYFFGRDDDCHNYLIPMNLKETYEQLRDCYNNEDCDKFNYLFGPYRIDGISGCWSFVDPQRI